jgi:hypothetical protein
LHCMKADFLKCVFKVDNPDGALVFEDGDALQIVPDHELNGMNDSVTHVHGWVKRHPFLIGFEDFVNFCSSHCAAPTGFLSEISCSAWGDRKTIIWPSITAKQMPSSRFLLPRGRIANCNASISLITLSSERMKPLLFGAVFVLIQMTLTVNFLFSIPPRGFDAEGLFLIGHLRSDPSHSLQMRWIPANGASWRVTSSQGEKDGRGGV